MSKIISYVGWCISCWNKKHKQIYRWKMVHVTCRRQCRWLLRVQFDTKSLRTWIQSKFISTRYHGGSWTIASPCAVCRLRATSNRRRFKSCWTRSVSFPTRTIPWWALKNRVEALLIRTSFAPRISPRTTRRTSSEHVDLLLGAWIHENGKNMLTYLLAHGYMKTVITCWSTCWRMDTWKWKEHVDLLVGAWMHENDKNMLTYFLAHGYMKTIRTCWPTSWRMDTSKR